MRRNSPLIFVLYTLLLTHRTIAAPQVPRSECRSLMDLVFVLDGSDSITSLDYQKQRETLKTFVQGLHLGPNLARVGLVVYSSHIAQTVPLTDDAQLLTKETSTLVHPRDGTKTSMGIATMRDIFKKSGRQGVPFVSIVITDGQSKNPLATKKEAALARDMGINMFAVGISHFIRRQELEAIASSPSQVLMLKTFDQLQLALTSLMKVVCPCPPLPAIKNGLIDKGARKIGSVRALSCGPGFQPMGNPQLTCLPDSTWTPLDFACLACPPPPLEFGMGIVAAGPVLLDTVREYICKDGFSSPEPILTKCMPGDTGPAWTIPAVVCQACPAPLVPPYAYLEPKIASATIGTMVAFQCIPGYIPTGPIHSTCISKMGIPGWTEPVHGCIACGPPPAIPYAEVDAKGGTLVNQVRTYMCLPGFNPTGPLESICMGENGATYWKMSPHKCLPCDEPPKLPNAVLNIPGDTLVGTTRTYQCLPGFQPTGPIGVSCMVANDVPFWDGPEHACVACVAPPLLPNTILDPLGDTLIGSVRHYKCMDGYVPTGPIAVGCISGTGGPLWTAPEYQCITCDMPPPIVHATLDLNGDNFVGRQRQYHCLPGFVPTKPGPITIECIGEYLNDRGKAFWSQPSHSCLACPRPPPIDLAVLEEPGDTLVGSVRTYTCVKGMFATGPITITCLPSGQWSLPDHSCTACGPVQTVANADVLPGPHTLGTIRKYRCFDGFVPDNPPHIECLIDAKWSPVGFACVACNDPYPVPNAVLEPGKNLVESIRRYTCLPGYLATGPLSSTCAVPSGGVHPDWSTPVHYCKDCGDPYTVKNADIVPGARVIGSVQTYVCHAGFVPSAPPNVHCMQNAEWTPPAFQCIAGDEPPILEHATVDTVGDVTVGSVLAYTCELAYVSTGPVEVACVTSGAVDQYLPSPPQWKHAKENFCKVRRPPQTKIVKKTKIIYVPVFKKPKKQPGFFKKPKGPKPFTPPFFKPKPKPFMNWKEFGSYGKFNTNKPKYFPPMKPQHPYPFGQGQFIPMGLFPSSEEDTRWYGMGKRKPFRKGFKNPCVKCMARFGGPIVNGPMIGNGMGGFAGPGMKNPFAKRMKRPFVGKGRGKPFGKRMKRPFGKSMIKPRPVKLFYTPNYLVHSHCFPHIVWDPFFWDPFFLLRFNPYLPMFGSGQFIFDIAYRHSQCPLFYYL